MAEHNEKKLPCFCKECGTRLNKEKKEITTCNIDHERYRTYSYKYCPKCGEKL